MKKATTVDEQIAKLTSRGMILDEGVEKAKEYLLDIGYFRLGFYCFPFEKTYPQIHDRTHEYKDGSLLSNVVKLYYLDVDLRHILLKYINRIEVHFRTSLIYWVSNANEYNCTWYMDPNIMQRNFIPTVETIYSEILKQNKVLKEHHRKYSEDRFAPVWKTLEFFTFGSIFKTYQNIKSEETKQTICRIYGFNSVKTLENYMQAIIDIRNACAHGKVLFDFSLYKGIKKGPALIVTDENRHNLFSAIKVINFILNTVSSNRAKEMNEKIHDLFNDVKSNIVIKNIVERSIGYSYP